MSLTTSFLIGPLLLLVISLWVSNQTECQKTDCVAHSPSNGFNTSVVSKSSRDETKIDMLPQSVTENKFESKIETVELIGFIDSHLNLSEIQENNETLKLIRAMVQDGVKPEWQDVSVHSQEVKFYWNRIDSFVMKNDILYRKWENDTGASYQLLAVIPKSHRKLVMEQLHNSKTAGHLGIKKTLRRVRDRYFWFAMRKDIEEWCKTCLTCNSKRGILRKPKAPLQTYNVGAPLERVGIDFMGPFPQSERSNKYLMVVGDYFTKWTECYPLPNLEASTVAKVFVEEFISRFGVPLICHTDQGKSFEAQLFKELCKILGIDVTRSSSFHPQSNGMIEKCNNTIITMLSAFVNENQKNWDELVPFVMLAYRSSVHSSTDMSPCMLMLGREVRLPVDLIFGDPEKNNPEKEASYTHFVKNLRDKMNTVQEKVRKNLKLSSDSMKTVYDAKLNFKIYKENDLVWYYYPTRRKGFSPKFQKPWIGPCKVLRKLNDLVYRIQIKPYGKPKVVHNNKLKPYIARNEGNW